MIADRIGKVRWPLLKERLDTLSHVGRLTAVHQEPRLDAYRPAKFGSLASPALELERALDDISVVSIWPLWTKTALAGEEIRSTQNMGIRIVPVGRIRESWKSGDRS
ncbi:hypothetical protein [Gordonia sp. (in: high G+C Gram-positive bacteria)]|uniref:hypothetical protein n=1 Tax=Gordonia sp. (in: high G+C Gram-positive bacteria) TaxID=84139 RepID=UPI003C73F8B9